MAAATQTERARELLEKFPGSWAEELDIDLHKATPSVLSRASATSARISSCAAYNWRGRKSIPLWMPKRPPRPRKTGLTPAPGNCGGGSATARTLSVCSMRWGAPDTCRSMAHRGSRRVSPAGLSNPRPVESVLRACPSETPASTRYRRHRGSVRSAWGPRGRVRSRYRR